MSKLLRPARVLLLGPPGSGKGTQTARLQNKFDLCGISSGDILRQHINNGTEIGQMASSIIKTGKLVPDDVMIKIISAELALRNWLSPTKSWLLDGFPRTRVQAEKLDEAELRPADARLNFVVELKVPTAVILDRIANRLVHAQSGRVYNLTYNPPKVSGVDDFTGEPLTRRPDDDPDIFAKRIEEYERLTEPLVDYYKKADNVLWSVAGDTSDVIYAQLEKEVVKRFGDRV
ncbi:adenylate kinase-domain-containing protein [Lipomyces arxii]|uniref:adenylate kinase-domain-containing protein n=1 Tax=Lipomyces arxii TaxID=56418 RepID=UPI0034CD7421